MGDQSRPVTGYPAAAQGYPPPGTNPNGYSTSTAGTAYPYAAPPPQPAAYYNQNPNPYYSQGPYAAQRATFLRRIFAIVVAAAIITGTIIFIVWLILRPQLPKFRVDSVSLSNFNLSSTTSMISGNWDVRLTARNPNKKITLLYDHIGAMIYYQSEFIADNTIPPFVQGTKSETGVRATFAASSAYIDRWAVNGINSDRGHGNVEFNVRILARVRFKAGAWRARRRFLRVLCEGLTVGVSSSTAGGSLTGGSKDCRVGL